MTQTIKAGTFTAMKTQITGLGFKPTAIWFYTANLTGNGYGSPAGAWEVANGYAARGGGVGVSTYSWDGGAVSETKNLTDRALQFPATGLANGRGTMTVASYDADGFTVSYPVAPTTQYKIAYIAFDCTAAKTFNTMWAGPYSDSFTGFGFEPDMLSLWINGAGVNATRTTGGSPSFSVLGTSLGGRNTTHTTSPGSTVTRSNDIVVSTLLQSASWNPSFGPYGCWGGIFQGCWAYGIQSWDPDGFTLSRSIDTNGAYMALLGIALQGEDMYVECGNVTLSANMTDVTITPTDVTQPKAFIFHPREDSTGSKLGDQFNTTPVATGCYDGSNQFICGTAWNSTGQFDDRYCVKFDGPQAGDTTTSPLALQGVSIVGGTLTLSKTVMPAGGETFRWTAIGLGGLRAVSFDLEFPQ
jgi:hypothetical protein